MSRADEIRAQARALRSAPRPADTVMDGPEVSPGVGAPLVRSVRRSVDLAPVRHAELTDWCAETARLLGRARVTGQDVLRALVARLLTDEALADTIRADLRATRVAG